MGDGGSLISVAGVIGPIEVTEEQWIQLLPLCVAKPDDPTVNRQSLDELVMRLREIQARQIQARREQRRLSRSNGNARNGSP